MPARLRSEQADRFEHPAIVRFCHWSSAIAIVILIGSGLQIFAAFPSFGAKIPQHDLFNPPSWVTLGGWLAGGLRWHFTFAWVFAVSGAVYGLYQLISGNYRQVLFVPSDIPGIGPMIRHYFLFGPKPPQNTTYNPLQKLAYTTALALGVVLIVTGFALYKPVQLSPVVTVLGGFGLVRVWHFVAMCGLAAFIPGHLVMVALHGWKNFSGMWTGGEVYSRAKPLARHATSALGKPTPNA
jgi:Ni/Fe-hydrogenase b-type cytochrome subunit